MTRSLIKGVAGDIEMWDLVSVSSGWEADFEGDEGAVTTESARVKEPVSDASVETPKLSSWIDAETEGDGGASMSMVTEAAPRGVEQEGLVTGETVESLKL